MISRLTTSAALFAVLATATLAFAADAKQQRVETARVAPAAAAATVIVLPRIEVVGRRTY